MASNNKWNMVGSNTKTTSPNDNETVTCIIPLPKSVIIQLKSAKLDRKKTTLLKDAQKGFEATYAAFFCMSIMDEVVVPRAAQNRDYLMQCVDHATTTTQSFSQLGLDDNDVLVIPTEQGMGIVLLDLQEAVFRADLFAPQQHVVLKELLSKCPVEDTVGDMTTTTTATTTSSTTAKQQTKKTLSSSSSSSKKTITTTTTTTTASPQKKKHPCMNAATCRNILNGTCIYKHSIQEYTQNILDIAIPVPVQKVGFLIGTNGKRLDSLRHETKADFWVDSEISLKQQTRMLHVLGNLQSVQLGLQMVQDAAADCDLTILSTTPMEALVGGVMSSKTKPNAVLLQEWKHASGGATFLVETVGKSSLVLKIVGTKETVEKGIDIVVKKKKNPIQDNTSSVGNKTVTTTDANTQSTSTISGGGTTAAAIPPPVVAPTPSNISTTNETAWPSLGQAGKQGTVVIAPVQPPPPVIPSVKPTLTTKKASSKMEPNKKKKKNSDVCIHGASCRFIRDGIDNCEFYHSARELELAAHRLAKNGHQDSEKFLYMPRDAMGYIIGKKGSSINEIIRESGAIIENDPVKNGNGRRIVRISGTQEAVDVAFEMVTNRLPKGFKVEPGPGASTSTVSAISSTSPTDPPAAPLKATPQPAPKIQVPSPVETMNDTVAANAVSTAPSADHNLQAPSPIQTLPDDSAVSTVTNPGPIAPSPSPRFEESPAATPIGPPQDLPSSNVSASSGGGTLLSDATRNNGTYPAAATNNHAAITGDTISPIQRPPGIPGHYNTSSFTPLQGQRLDQQYMTPEAIVRPSFDLTKPSPVPSLVSSPSLVSNLSSSRSMIESPPSSRAFVSAQVQSETLSALLEDQRSCIKGSPEGFCEWLATEDITSIADLAEAVADDDYLRDVLQQGDGTNGVKGFKRKAFKVAIMKAASQPPQPTAGSNTNQNTAEVKSTSNAEPTPELICPISHVLMVEDPVIAADGYTYERAAIEAWFHRQHSEVMMAKQHLASGGGDPRAHSIVERGVLSPMTHAQMPNLNLTSNLAVRTMAKAAGPME